MAEKLEPYSKPQEFADAVVPFLKRDEARYNVLLGVIDTLIQRPDVFKEHYLAAFKDMFDKVRCFFSTWTKSTFFSCTIYGKGADYGHQARVEAAS